MLLNYNISCIVLGLLYVGVSVQLGWVGIRAAGSPDTTPAEPHPNSNTQQSKNNTANVLVQQQSRRLLKMEVISSWFFILQLSKYILYV